MPRTGGCKCGAIRYTLAAEPLATRLCWCRDCQYWAMGNAAVNIMVPRAAVSVTGQPQRFESVADSGNRMARAFCALCGTHLFSQSSGNPMNMVIRVGSLDDAGGIVPDVVIWTDSAPPWAHIDPGLQAFPRQPG